MSATAAVARLPRWSKLLLLLIVIAFGWSLCQRAITLSDEGYLLLQAEDMLAGRVLYRDLDSFVAPGVWFLLAGLFWMVEPSVFASRLLALAGFAATVWVAYRIVVRVADERYGIATIATFMVFSVWAFPAWSFSFYSPYSVLFAMAALERVLAWQAAGRPRDALAVGVMLGLSIAFKQNYGVFALVASAAAVLATFLATSASLPRAVRDTVRTGAWVTAGVAIAALPFAAYFVYHGTLGDAFDALVLHPFSDFATQHTIAFLGPEKIFDATAFSGLKRLTYGAYLLTNVGAGLDWPGWAIRGAERLHVVMYWLPVLLFLAAGWLVIVSWRRAQEPDVGLMAVLAVCAAVFLGVFPRADFNHLVNVYQPVVVLGVVVAHRIVRALAPHRALAMTTTALFALLMAAYSTVAAVWYLDLLRTHDTPITAERGGILLHRWQAQMIDYEVEAIRRMSDEEDSVLTVPGLAMLNFLADRTMPSRYYNLYAVHIAHDSGAGVVEGAEVDDVDLVVAEYHDFFSDEAGLRDFAPALADYLRDGFKEEFSVGIDRHMFMRRRASPLPHNQTTSLLAQCDLGAHPFAPRAVRSHLLFDSLYHRFGTGRIAENKMLETTCVASVPAQATLSLRVGYRQPIEVEDGTTLRVEILAFPADGSALVGSETLLDTSMIVTPVAGWSSPPARELRIDLARLAGKKVRLVLRTTFAGRVDTEPGDIEGFTMVWHDPRIESPHAARQAQAPRTSSE